MTLLAAWLGDSDSNRDCTAPKAGGLPITPSPICATTTVWPEPGT